MTDGRRKWITVSKEKQEAENENRSVFEEKLVDMNLSVIAV